MAVVDRYYCSFMMRRCSNSAGATFARGWASAAPAISAGRGGWGRTITVVTTLTDPLAYPAEHIAELEKT